MVFCHTFSYLSSDDVDIDNITTAADFDDEEDDDDPAEKIAYEKFMKMVQDGTGNI